ncbi:hypothetical protein HanRHA438_Chr17g0835181 [Helianthus annuus]|uniref:Uncharacterized protein n=1 Tax=Helianthus annuus TaxID=4232 RepID=A0A9K3DMF5_HELAN|nr:hypothetical protein HanXRQr2_Chr17g0825281 [Helianthus annuus]KAJ0449145.1 hypothetical protein HanHA89_Chr17g0725101 [Helianthus annuus]KAJ0828257.1 hypothetical protein HanRHA438_Chr17g0835181 [Helianthus annuus]
MKTLLYFSISLILYSQFSFTQSAKLDTQEVKVLKQIWGKLGLEDKNEWDFDKDPCSPGRWQLFVVCDCSFESNTTCRVTQMYVFRSYFGSLLAECDLGKTKSCS